jgi:hypothetical protein
MGPRIADFGRRHNRQRQGAFQRVGWCEVIGCLTGSKPVAYGEAAGRFSAALYAAGETVVVDTTGLVQRLLFDQDQRKKQAGLDVATDPIRERFGSSALRRTASMPNPKDPRSS